MKKHNIISHQPTMISIALALASTVASTSTALANHLLVPHQNHALHYSTTVPSAFSPAMYFDKTANRVASGFNCEGCGACEHPPEVTVPCEDSDKAWYLGFTGFLQEVTVNNQDFATREATRVGVNNSVIRFRGYLRASPDFNYGYEVEGGYRAWAGNDIRMTYAHGQQRVYNSIGTFSGTFTSRPVIVSDFAIPTTDSVDANFIYKYDIANAELGQHIDLGQYGIVRLHAGAQFADIKATKLIYAEDDVVPDRLVVMNSELEGVGARVGADLTHNIGAGFGALFHFSGALLYAKNDVDGSDTQQGTGVVGAYAFKNDGIVVPTLEARAGFQVAFDLSHGEVAFEGGYKFTGYFHALQFVRGIGAEMENFTVHGAYLTARYTGDLN